MFVQLCVDEECGAGMFGWLWRNANKPKAAGADGVSLFP